MAAYVIVNLTVKDPEAYKEYIAKAPAYIKKHGGEYLVRGGAITVEEGNWKPNRLVILKYPSADAAKKMFADPEYAPLKKLRQSVTTGEIVIVEGL
ncbi:MAG TPA: DUF1330 domain-containing protein [bacterium]